MREEKSSARGSWGIWISLTLVFLWSLYRALVGDGWALDDELAHFTISRSVWSDPTQLLHLWSRPGRNLLEFWPTLLGLKATRVWVLLLAMLAIWLTVAEGRRLKMQALWALPLLVGFQCWFPELAASVLTQTPFMLVWIAGIFFAARGRLVAAALCWGFLGLIRHEGIALSALWGLWVIAAPDGFLRLAWQKNWQKVPRAFGRAAWLGFWTLLPNIVLNVSTRLASGKWPFLIFLDDKPTTMYGSGSLFHFVPLIVMGAGFPVLLLALKAGRKARPVRWENALYWTYPCYFLLHSVIFWRGLFASGGYYHFLMPMAPWLALLALRGMRRMSPFARAAGVGAVVFLGLLLPQVQLNPRDSLIPGMPPARPLGERLQAMRFPAPRSERSEFQKGLQMAADWLDANLARDQQWIAPHLAVDFSREKESGKKLTAFNYADRKSKESLPSGTILVWDSLYSPQQAYAWHVDAAFAEKWIQRASFENGTVRIFEKR